MRTSFDNGPLYIVGNSRSGTTVLSMAMTNHSDIFSFRELHFFEKFWNDTPSKAYVDLNEAVSIMSKLLCGQREGFLYCKDPSVYEAEAHTRLSGFLDNGVISLSDIYAEFLHYETDNSGKRIPCEQTPHNVFYIKTILEMFPNARVIAMIRDPRDVLLSQKKKAGIKYTGKGKVPLKERIRTWANYHPYIMSKMWKRAASEIDRWKESDNVMVLRFEDLVTEPEQTFGVISQFLNIEYQDALLDVPQIGSSNVSDDAGNKGMNKDVLAKWKRGLSRSEIAICENINKLELKKFGYELSETGTVGLSIVLQYMTLPLRGVMSVIMNLGRSKNILRSIVKRLFR